MLDHQVNRAAIDQIIHHFAQICGQGQYNFSDVALAVAEFTGRMIVSTCDTPVSAVQLAVVIEEHIKRTLHAGYTAKGFNMGQADIR